MLKLKTMSLHNYANTNNAKGIQFDDVLPINFDTPHLQTFTYTRHFLVGLKAPTYYLVWYNITASTNWKNGKVYCYAAIDFSYSTITTSSLEPNNTIDSENNTHNPFVKTSYVNNILTSMKVQKCLYLDTITNPINNEAVINLKDLFNELYKIVITALENTFPNNFFIGMNNVVVKNEFNVDLLFRKIVEKLKEIYAFFYTIKNFNLYDTRDNLKSTVECLNLNIDEWVLSEVLK